VRTISRTGDLFGDGRGGAADLPYPVRGLDIADRPFDGIVPDFSLLVPVEPSHCNDFK